MTEQNCPDCGGPTTEKGVTVDGSAIQYAAKWDSCLNCEWDSRPK